MNSADRPSQGFVYYSFGQTYLDETFVSIQTLLEHNPGVRICLITDEAGETYVKENYSQVALDQLKRVDINQYEGFWAFRLRLDQITPYEKTIFLDGDTYVVHKIDDLFDLLDTFDFVAVPDESHPARGFILGLKGGYKALNYYNCGFFVFRNSPVVHALFENWRQEYVAFASLEPGDQGPLVRALVKTPVRFITLPQEYNLRLIDKCVSFQGKVKIIHGRSKDPAKLMRMINDVSLVDEGSRVWVPNLQRVIKATQFGLYHKFLRLFNLDNVQKSAHAKEENRSVFQKILRRFNKRNTQETIAIKQEMDKALQTHFQGRNVVWQDVGQVASGDVKECVGNLAKASDMIVLTVGLPTKGQSPLQKDTRWTQLITEQGFYFDPQLTLKCRQIAQDPYFKQCTIVFEKNARPVTAGGL